MHRPDLLGFLLKYTEVSLECFREGWLKKSSRTFRTFWESKLNMRCSDVMQLNYLSVTANISYKLWSLYKVTVKFALCWKSYFCNEYCLNACRIALDGGLSNYIHINKLLLFEQSKISIAVENVLEMDTQNAITFWSISRFLRLNRISKEILLFISRYIIAVSETDSFLRLNFEQLSIILASSELSLVWFH